MTSQKIEARVVGYGDKFSVRARVRGPWYWPFWGRWLEVIMKRIEVSFIYRAYAWGTREEATDIMATILKHGIHVDGYMAFPIIDLDDSNT